MKIQRITTEKFEGCLDIKQLVKTHLNLNQLLNILLSPAQKCLFLHHRGRLINPNKNKKKKDDVWTFDNDVDISIQELLHGYKA